MVKPEKPQSQQPEPNAHAHPLLRQMTQVDNFAAAARARKEQKEFQIEELKVWKDTVNGLAASDYGRMFLFEMIRHAGMHEPASYRDTMRMVDVGLKSAFYLQWVRPFLTPELRGRVEL